LPQARIQPDLVKTTNRGGEEKILLHAVVAAKGGTSKKKPKKGHGVLGRKEGFSGMKKALSQSCENAKSCISVGKKKRGGSKKKHVLG